MNHFASKIAPKTLWALRMLAKAEKLGTNGYSETWPEAVGTLLATVEGLIDGISQAAGDNGLTDLILSTLDANKVALDATDGHVKHVTPACTCHEQVGVCAACHSFKGG